MGEFSTQIRHLLGRAASEQGGVISGDNPASYNPSDPIRLWIIQIVIIIAMSQLLSLFLARIRQPRVISEVIGGIILGPTVMGRIPGFRSSVFPETSIPMLTLTSTIGLVLFLFLIGLEIDIRILKRHGKASALISAAGLVLPLGLGAALGVGVYREFIDPSVNFGYFLLFTAVAVGITAFPVLCRILTELKLLDTTVGVVVLAAGIGNDVIGWVLLALTVALVNASSGLTALWVLLAGIGYVIMLLYPGRWAFVWLARRTGSLEQGSPTAGMMTITLLVVFVSAFFTDIIGIHAIFGGFLAGLIIPHENGFAISLVEKLEDLVSILFLPIYFVLSGLRTDLGLLDNGITWGYTIIICLVAFFSKFVACATAASITGFNWRESGAIGALMSCKGLVELIVLNIGLQAKILDTRTFSMFVVHALILTIMTTPLTIAFYPERLRHHEGRTIKEKPSVDNVENAVSISRFGDVEDIKTKFALVLDKVEQLPAAMTLSQLLQATPAAISKPFTPSFDGESVEDTKQTVRRYQSPITINALRLIELTNRTSAVLKSQLADSLIHNDPVISVFKTFGYLNKILVSATLSVVGYDEYPTAITKHTLESDSQLVIMPWPRGITSVSEDDSQTVSTIAHNPFDGVFHKTTIKDQTSSVVYSEFIRNVFHNSPVDVALFVDRGVSSHSINEANQQLFLPFFGGPDDRLALSFLVQLCSNTSVTATVVRYTKTDDLSLVSTIEVKVPNAAHIASSSPIVLTTLAGADTVYGRQSTQIRLASDTADNILWDRYTLPSESHSLAVMSALSRIQFSTQTSSSPLHALTDLAKTVVQESPGRTPIVITGRSRRMAVESHLAELTNLMNEVGSSIGSLVPKTLGDVGAALVAANVNASLLVLQAAVSS